MVPTSAPPSTATKQRPRAIRLRVTSSVWSTAV